ncbi:hypothetical protein NLG97_g5229 [Lecanicillium saksenae]|uniref:Uncharacterized protein n=1 Tax=Lecanicillium saksenae TaxID=468837 RepID=A0ACC1QW83_9HYPO|nr:hypothetical protein NLG97_g5229 [Lecanicillium saksenae]
MEQLPPPRHPRLFPGAFAPLRIGDFNGVKQTFIRRLLFEDENPVTMREGYLRSVMAVYWAAGAIVLVDGVHTTLSLLFVVVLRANKPAEWPPMETFARRTRFAAFGVTFGTASS